MKTTFRHALTAIAVLTGILSLISLLWWIPFAYGIATGENFQSTTQRYAPHLLDSLPSNQLFFIQAREYFGLIGGAFGWVALLGLFMMWNRALARVPRWIVVGCLVGIAAAIAMPAPMLMAAPPVAAAVSLLLRSHLMPPI